MSIPSNLLSPSPSLDLSFNVANPSGKEIAKIFVSIFTSKKSQLHFSLCSSPNEGSIVGSTCSLLVFLPSLRMQELQFCGHPLQNCYNLISQFLLTFSNHILKSFPPMSFFHFLGQNQLVGESMPYCIFAPLMPHILPTEFKTTLLPSPVPLYGSNKHSEYKTKQTKTQPCSRLL